MTSTWAHFKELRLFFKMSPISSIRLEDTNLQTWGWWTKSFPWFAWIFVILGGPWFLWKYRWAMKTISAHAGDGITTKKLVPDPFFSFWTFLYYFNGLVGEKNRESRMGSEGNILVSSVSVFRMICNATRARPRNAQNASSGFYRR